MLSEGRAMMPDSTQENDPVMKFGKHKGMKISEINTNYLDWLIGQPWFKDPLKSIVKNTLQGRADWMGE